MKWFWKRKSRKQKDFGMIYLHQGCQVKSVDFDGEVSSFRSVVQYDDREPEEAFFLLSPAKKHEDGLIIEIEIAELLESGLIGLTYHPKRQQKILVMNEEINDGKFEYLEKSDFIMNSISLSSDNQINNRSISIT